MSIDSLVKNLDPVKSKRILPLMSLVLMFYQEDAMNKSMNKYIDIKNQK